MTPVKNTLEFCLRYPDFRDFLFVVWAHLGLPNPTAIQLDMAHSLDTGDKRFILEAFRGIGKSWITVAWAVYLLAKHNEWNILVVSASKVAADEFSTFALRLIREMDDLEWLAPSGDEKDSKIAWDIHGKPASKAPSVKSLGIGSQLTGSRADVIILDDIEIPSNSLTPGMRAKLAESIKECDSILKPDAHCRVVFLGTPQTESSVYNVLLQRGYTCRIWPARYPNQEEQEEYGTRLAPSILRAVQQSPRLIGAPTEPTRFGDSDLQERLLSYGRAGFAQQFMIRTKLSDLERYPLKVADLITMDTDLTTAPEKPIWTNDRNARMDVLNNLAMDGDFFYRPQALVGAWLPYTGIVMVIDPSGRGADETGYAVVAMLNGYLYVLACSGLKGGYDEVTLKALASIAKYFKVNRIVIESNFGDGMYTNIFKPVLAQYWEVSIEEVKHSTQKERRICDTLEPVIQQHRLVFNSHVIETDFESIQVYPTEQGYAYSLFYQMSRITRERGALGKDDRLDALAIAVSYWNDSLASDADTDMRDYKSSLLDAYLEEMMEEVHGPNATQPNVQFWKSNQRT